MPSEYQKSSLEDHRKMKTCKIGQIQNFCSRETLHVHNARHGRASSTKLSAPIEVATGNRPTKF